MRRFFLFLAAGCGARVVELEPLDEGEDCAAIGATPCGTDADCPAGLLCSPADGCCRQGSGCRPDLTVDPPSLDFGAPQVGTESYHEMICGNVGCGDLTCTAAVVEKDDNPEITLEGPGSFTISAGEFVTLGVTLRPTDGEAEYASIRLRCDDPDEPEVFVPCENEIVGDATPAVCVHDTYPPPGDCEPDGVADFGAPAEGETAARVFSLGNAGDGNRPLGVLSLASEDDRLSFETFTLAGVAETPVDLPVWLPPSADARDRLYVRATFVSGGGNLAPIVIGTDLASPLDRIEIPTSAFFGDGLAAALAWDGPGDMDIHMVRCSGEDPRWQRAPDAVYWANPQEDWCAPRTNNGIECTNNADCAGMTTGTNDYGWCLRSPEFIAWCAENLDCEGCTIMDPVPCSGAPAENVCTDATDDPFLQIDDCDGFGPEAIVTDAPCDDTYAVAVDYFGGPCGSGGGDAEPRVATVRVFYAGVEIAGSPVALELQPEDFWYVGRVVVSGGAATFEAEPLADGTNPAPDPTIPLLPSPCGG